VLFVDSRQSGSRQLSLGLCIGQLCYFRFIQPASLDARGVVVPLEPLEQEAVQCAPEQVVAILGRGALSLPELEAALAAAQLVWQSEDT